MTLASNASDERRVGREQKMRLHDFLDYHARLRARAGKLDVLKCGLASGRRGNFEFPATDPEKEIPAPRYRRDIYLWRQSCKTLEDFWHSARSSTGLRSV